MTRFAYWVCFALVALSSVRGWSATLLYLSGVREPFFLGALSSILAFSSPVPLMLRHLVPGAIYTILSLTVLGLVLRRIWLLATKKERVPASFRGIPKALGLIGMFSFMASALMLVLTAVLGGGSGVPAGLALLPALICVPWSVFLTELLSVHRGARSAV